MHKVYSIKKKKYSKKYFVNFLDFTHDSLELGLDVIMKYNITKGQELSETILIDALSEQQLKDTKLAAYNYVSYKPRSEFEVRQRLERKEFSSDSIDKAIEFLYEFNFLNDEEFANMFVKNFIKKTPSGEFKLKQELLKRGISEDFINKSIAEYYPSNKALEMAEEAAKKHLKKVSHKPKVKQKKLISDFLARRGFDWDVVNKCIDKMF